MRKILLFTILAVFGFASSGYASDDTAKQEKTWQEWKQDIARQARARGISEPTVSLLKDLERDERVIGFDRKQPEFVQTFEEYLTARVTPDRIKMARDKFRENREVLTAIGRAYKVDPEYLIAFWGLESSFGRYQGKYSVVRSLATLAYDPRRSAFFTTELFSALRILDEGHVAPAAFVGGWAGAMGQNQFLPSSFLKYAQDFDGDGRKNIWSDTQDVWASIANYLALNGWRAGAGWGTRVQLPEGFVTETIMPQSVAPGCRALRHHTRSMSLLEWQALGVTGKLDRLTLPAYALVVPDEGELQSYLVAGNFRSILSYNCANKYAVSVGLLADLIREGVD